jgi:uncharacterized delta-60 repeat protein
MSSLSIELGREQKSNKRMFSVRFSCGAVSFISACLLIHCAAYAISPSAVLDTNFAIGSGAGFPSDGSSWPQVTAVAVQNDGKVIAGGQAYFTNFNGTAISSFCRINTNGTLDTAFQTNVATGPVGAGLTVSKIVVQPDGKILVGGTFATFNGFARSGLTRLNSDGSVDTSFLNSGTGAGGTFAPNVATIALQSDGKIIVGGFFYTFNGTAVPSVVRLNTDGTVDNSFALPIIQGLSIGAVGLQPDGKVYVGGTFTNWQGFGTPGIVRLNTNGSRDASFAPTHLHPFPSITALAAPGDGTVFVGGFVEGTTTNTSRYFAHLGTNGVIDSLYPTTDGPVADLQQWPFGGLLVAGRFRSVSGVSRGSFCYFDSTGHLNATFAPQPNSNPTNDFTRIYSMSVAPDGKVVFGGWFTNYPNNTQLNGQNYSGIGRFVGAPIVTYSNWAVASGLTAANNAPGQDPDGDGIPNFFEYYSGTNPLDPLSGSRPSLTMFHVTGPGAPATYPMVALVHNKTSVGALVPKVSSNVTFSDSLGWGLSTADLGNGTEELDVRANLSVSDTPSQFLEILLQYNP